MHVAIVGAGIGGLAAAAALLQRGVNVQVYEQADALGEVGAGIQMTPNAAKVLRALGLQGGLDRMAFRPKAIYGLNWRTGRQAFHTPLLGYCDRVYGADYYQIHRADLHDMLRGLVPADRIHLAHRCGRIDQDSNGATLHFEHGGTATADLVVGADGIRSVVRSQLFTDVEPSYTGNMCWRAVVPIDPPDFKLVLPGSSMWFGPKGHVVTYYVRAGAAVNIVAIHETDHWEAESWSTPSSREELCAAYANWHPRVRELLSRTETVFKWGLFDRDPMEGWTKGRVTLLGDAAHPMLPFLSQGAAMAIEDGYVLARALTEVPGDLTAKLAAYEADRLPRTAQVQLGARERGRSYHQTSRLGQWWRDLKHWWRALRDPHASGLQANWIYAYDATTTPLG
jgi:salicylate hydroxylase